MLSVSTLQSLLRINADDIMCRQAHYQSFRDFSKHAFHAGKEDVHKKYLALAKKELRKLHLLERNQKEMLWELEASYQHEDFVRLTDSEDYLRYSDSDWD